MLDTVRKYVDAGRDALTPKKAEELARALIKQGQSRTDKVQELARELADWSKRNSERFRDTVRREVQKQMEKAGVASKTEVEALKRRIRQLESSAKAAPKTAAKSPAKKTAAKAPAAKPPATKPPATSAAKTPARKPTGTPGATIGGGETPTG